MTILSDFSASNELMLDCAKHFFAENWPVLVIAFAVMVCLIAYSSIVLGDREDDLREELHASLAFHLSSRPEPQFIEAPDFYREVRNGK